jgi:hypothetical protein
MFLAAIINHYNIYKMGNQCSSCCFQKGAENDSILQ